MKYDTHLVPNDRRWGMGYGGRRYTAVELSQIAANLSGNFDPTYGPRLMGSMADFSRDSRLWLPEGYDATGHPHRRFIDDEFYDPDIPTSQSKVWQVHRPVQEYFRGQFCPLDMHGRPCNPLAKELLAHPGIGLNTGIGCGYYFGENPVIQILITHGDKLLIFDPSLVQGLVRGFTLPEDYGLTAKKWKLGKRPVTARGLAQAAHRKLRQKGVLMPSTFRPLIAYASRPVYPQHTINFWTVEYTLWFQLRSGTEISTQTPSTAQFMPLSEASKQLPEAQLRDIQTVLTI